MLNCSGGEGVHAQTVDGLHQVRLVINIVYICFAAILFKIEIVWCSVNVVKG